MAETAQKLMTLAEFLAWDDGTDTLRAGARPARRHGAGRRQHSVIIDMRSEARLKAPCYAG